MAKKNKPVRDEKVRYINEIIKYHDLFGAAVGHDELRAILRQVSGSEASWFYLKGISDALCWIFRHPAGAEVEACQESLQQTLETMGYKLVLLDKPVPAPKKSPHVAPGISPAEQAVLDFVRRMTRGE